MPKALFVTLELGSEFLFFALLDKEAVSGSRKEPSGFFMSHFHAALRHANGHSCSFRSSAMLEDYAHTKILNGSEFRISCKDFAHGGRAFRITRLDICPPFFCRKTKKLRISPISLVLFECFFDDVVKRYRHKYFTGKTARDEDSSSLAGAVLVGVGVVIVREDVRFPTGLAVADVVATLAEREHERKYFRVLVREESCGIVHRKPPFCR